MAIRIKPLGEIKYDIDINQHEICHETSKPFYGSSVQPKDLMNETAGGDLRDSSRRFDN